MSPIEAVLFDFGGVILTSPFEAFARYESDRGLPPGFIRTLNATDPHHNAWARLERGELDLEGFAAVFRAEAAAAGHPIDAHEVLGLLVGELRPLMVDVLHRCARRYRTGLLTNNIAAMGSAAPPEWAEVLAVFDVIVESSTEGVRKPDPRFYRLACERLAIEPSAAVFLDDLGVNLKPARAMGMTTIKVDDPVDAVRQLQSVLDIELLPPEG